MSKKTTKTVRKGPRDIRWQVFESLPDGGSRIHNYGWKERKLRDQKVAELKAAGTFENIWDCHDNPISNMFKL
jgi:hypothetical protein